MPTLSMFYGIIIRIYNNGEHNPPHFHASYQDYNAVFNFEGDLMEGEMPNKQRKMIAAWAEIHKDTVIWNDDVDIAPEHLYENSVPVN